MANKGERGRIRVFFAEVEVASDDQAIQEDLRVISVAANKIFQSSLRKAMRVLSASAVSSDEGELVKELDAEDKTP